MKAKLNVNDKAILRTDRLPQYLKNIAVEIVAVNQYTFEVKPVLDVFVNGICVVGAGETFYVNHNEVYSSGEGVIYCAKYIDRMRED